MITQIILKMIQITPHLWQVVSPKGSIMQNNVIAHNATEATEYIKRYASSWPEMGYTVLPLDTRRLPK